MYDKLTENDIKKCRKKSTTVNWLSVQKNLRL